MKFKKLKLKYHKKNILRNTLRKRPDKGIYHVIANLFFFRKEYL